MERLGRLPSPGLGDGSVVDGVLGDCEDSSNLGRNRVLLNIYLVIT
jgi:hypothetical protein